MPCATIIPADKDPAAWRAVDFSTASCRLSSPLSVALPDWPQGGSESCLTLFSKEFIDLDSAQQDELLRKLESNQAPGAV